MNIQTALNEAIKKGRGIARHKDDPHPKVLIATNTQAGTIVTDYNSAFVKWEPTLEELVASDWYVK